MTNKSKLKVLDCTLRDGGYYNNWDFNESLVEKYLSAMSMAKVDIVEIGFRFLPQKKFLGKFAYSEDDFLNSISLPSTISYAVMINASDLIGEACLAIEMGSCSEDIALTIHPHPTLTETFSNTAEVMEKTITDLYIP